MQVAFLQLQKKGAGARAGKKTSALVLTPGERNENVFSKVLPCFCLIFKRDFLASVSADTLDVLREGCYVVKNLDGTTNKKVELTALVNTAKQNTFVEHFHSDQQGFSTGPVTYPGKFWTTKLCW
jgi:hypothetical protein